MLAVDECVVPAAGTRLATRVPAGVPTATGVSTAAGVSTGAGASTAYMVGATSQVIASVLWLSV